MTSNSVSNLGQSMNSFGQSMNTVRSNSMNTVRSNFGNSSVTNFGNSTIGPHNMGVTVLPQSRTIAQAESNLIAERQTFGIEKGGDLQRQQILFGSKGINNSSSFGHTGASIINPKEFKSGVHNNSKRWMTKDSIYSAAAPY